LVWDNDDKGGGGINSNVAYELQWRERSKTLDEWKTSPTLIVSGSCRKKNLSPQKCYEFRVRAASAFGWSGYSDSVSVMTTALGGASGVGGDTDKSSKRDKAAAAAESRCAASDADACSCWAQLTPPAPPL
jgi:hypothetical protein